MGVGTKQLRVGSRLEWVLESGQFAVTTEIAPPASSDPSEIRTLASLYRGVVDACNVTDCQRALVKMSSFGASVLAMREGIEPIMQMVLRDRNRIALQADVLGASALGVRAILCLRGDDPKVGNEKDAAGVFDLNTEEMISMFRAMRDVGTLRGGDKIDHPPKFLIGAAANPLGGNLEQSFANVRGKVTAGADFIQTQAIYDIDSFEEWMRLVRKEWLHEKVHILAGVIPLRSPKFAHFLVDKVPGIVIPKDIMERMESAPDARAEGMSIALRTIKALRKIEGVRGVHVMAINWDDVVPLLVKEAGLLPRPTMPREPL